MKNAARLQNKIPLLLLFISAVPALATTGDHGPMIWQDYIPSNCPFPRSTFANAIEFTGPWSETGGADTFFPSWASNDTLYTPFADGNGSLCSGYQQEPNVTVKRQANVGMGRVAGSDPLKVQASVIALLNNDPYPYGGRYPCGTLVYNGVWYYGTYCLGSSGRTWYNGFRYNWPFICPFVGFDYSTDYGTTWKRTACTPFNPLFGESASTFDGLPYTVENGHLTVHSDPRYTLKVGAPHFVDFGKNMENSPDGKAYLVAHGSTAETDDRFEDHSWITGDQVYLLRVTPSIANINDSSKYEYWTGSTWSPHFGDLRPLLAWNNKMGCVTITYNKPLKKYFMCVTDGQQTAKNYNSYLLESASLTGPWKIITYMRDFGEQGFFLNIPSKFISAGGDTMWLSYSANFWSGTPSPPGSTYRINFQKFRLLTNSRGPYYEAERGIKYGGARNYHDSAASKGTWGVTLDTAIGAGLEFYDVAPGDELTICYSSITNGTFSLYINGTHTTDLHFASTGALTGANAYKTMTVRIAIPANADLKFQRDSTDTGINIDYIIIRAPVAVQKKAPLSTEKRSPGLAIRNSGVIRYSVPGTAGNASRVILSLVDLHGTIVSELVNTMLLPGDYSAVLPGKNRTGNSIVPGTYLLRMKANTALQQMRIVSLP